jgi:shikimate kinase/3-dehydroquinate synthase
VAETRRVVLVGFMAAGKTTVGRELAALLGWDFRDLDAWIEERAGATVAEIFDRRGEEFFREQERRAAGEAASLARCVVAAGGGAFATPATRESLRQGALTVWLRCALDTVIARTSGDRSRPLARDRERMRRLFAEREPFYGLADLAVDTDHASPAEVARRIAQAMREMADSRKRR